MSLRLSGGRRLQSPPGEETRPTAARVRLAAMNLLAPELQGCRWLDLCSGSGVMACEALQRGAAAVVAVERNRRVAAIAEANLAAVAAGLSGRPEVAVHCCEVLRFLAAAAPQPFDLIYADPPYAAGLYAGIAAGVAAGGWLAAEGTLVFECAANNVPALQPGWRQRDERRYGSCALQLLERA
jgi:16S rRNA (guanine(966)-N(2))-methyltransferase RsmD